MPEEKCLCIKCCEERSKNKPQKGLFGEPLDSFNTGLISTDLNNFRYACEICGNKRCPHHSDHNLPCTGSNESGQEGSVYQ